MLELWTTSLLTKRPTKIRGFDFRQQKRLPCLIPQFEVLLTNLPRLISDMLDQTGIQNMPKFLNSILNGTQGIQ